MSRLPRLLCFALALRCHAAITIPLTRPFGFEANHGQFPLGILYGFRPGAYLQPNTLALREGPLLIQFAGADPNAVMRPGDALPIPVNTFIGADPAKWVTNAKQYSS